MKLNDIKYLRDISKIELQELFNSSDSVSSVLGKLGFIPQRKDSRKLINELIISLGIDLSEMHLNLQQKVTQANSSAFKAGNFEFSRGKFIQGTHLIKHLRKIGREMKCSECPITDTYNGKPISLQVHHIDGDNSNNELDNLALLCPNCHSQTDSYCGKKNKKPSNKCKCGVEIRKESTFCRKCSHENQLINGRIRRKFEIPKDELEKLISEKPMTEIGKMFGVSDTAVKKRCIKLGIELKSMSGYWRKVETGKI